MTPVLGAIGVVGLGGLSLSLVACVVAAESLRRLQRRSRGEPVPGFAPPVSILKPLKGLDEELEANLETFFRLDYPTFEVVFSFADVDDPAYAVARRVADRHPDVASTFVFDGRERGGNAKVNRLAAAMGYARHRLVLFSDGNVRVRRDFLARAVSWFSQPEVGLVSNLFRAAGAESLGSRLEALYLNGCLQGGTALIASALGMPCVVGKSILVSRGALDAVEGIGALRDYLAEDFVLGRRVRRAGYRVILSADVLETSEVAKSLGAVWRRHRRWAMMRAKLGGPLYLGELLTSPLPWFAAALVSPSPGVRIAAGVLLFLRWAVEIAAMRLASHEFSWRDAFLLPVRDLGAAAVFWAGLLGRTLSWRGKPMEIGPETRIVRQAP